MPVGLVQETEFLLSSRFTIVEIEHTDLRMANYEFVP
jgi:hypothetical protein